MISDVTKADTLRLETQYGFGFRNNPLPEFREEATEEELSFAEQVASNIILKVEG